MLVTIESEIVEVVVGGDLADLVVQFVGAVKSCVLAGNHHERISATGDFAAAFPHGDIGLVAGGVYVDAVLAGTLNLKGGIRRIDLEAVVVIKMANAEYERTLRQTDLSGVVVE